MSDRKLLFVWRWLIASGQGPTSPTTRHVLLTLSLHMAENGSRAYPSEHRLAEETQLSERAVGIHLQKAVDAGWISRQRRRNGRAWAQYDYQAVIPPHLRGTERRSGRRTERHARGPEPDDVEVPNDVRTNTTRTSTKKSTAAPEPTAETIARRRADCQAFLDRVRKERNESRIPRANPIGDRDER